MNRNNRLGRGKDLDFLLQRGRRISHPFFSVVWREDPGRAGSKPGYRLACIIPRAVDKHATARNRLRRRVSEFIRVHSKDSTSPLDIAILCRRAAIAATRPQLYAALKELLLRLHSRRR